MLHYSWTYFSTILRVRKIVYLHVYLIPHVFQVGRNLERQRRDKQKTFSLTNLELAEALILVL